ncbi:hypothetical protein PDE_06343 [Penicillium oxalicum 114-2]|uniref:Uncharacterized protein n=1 Tax=Penicillium oxalicum (strain 114-2 / CGMCC 5302) TaxID=933388 RepID=S8AYF3_PENO1|nr:hypothetical protein PDE_06343 [Penicillium oxalicum 114-2]
MNFAAAAFTTPRSSSPIINSSTSSSSSSSTKSYHSTVRFYSLNTPSATSRRTPLETERTEQPKPNLPDTEYYRKTFSVQLSRGTWLAHEISNDQVINGIPTVGYVNEFNQPLPSIVGPDIQLTLATLDTISCIGETNDEDSMMNLSQVFYLRGPRKGQLHDAYAWIALREDGENRFAMSRRARNRLVPRWKDLVHGWEEFDESVTDACHELQRVSARTIAETIYCLKELGAEEEIELLRGNVEEMVDRENLRGHPRKELVESAREVLLAASAFEDVIGKLQRAAEKRML